MRTLSLAILLAAAACGDDGATIDAAIVVDIDNGSCGDQLRFTGAYVDWDSTDLSFCGIGAAVVEVEGDGAMDTTAPNGRFDLCIPRMNVQTRLTVTQPTGMSQCTTPPAVYTIPTLLVAHRDVILAGGVFNGRAFTAARQATFFQDAGLTFDPATAQVVVNVSGNPRAVSLAATHDAVQAFTTTWAPGDTGAAVFFPNVEVGNGSTTVTVAGGAIGTGPIPLVAGTLTNVTVHVP